MSLLLTAKLVHLSYLFLITADWWWCWGFPLALGRRKTLWRIVRGEISFYFVNFKVIWQGCMLIERHICYLSSELMCNVQRCIVLCLWLSFWIVVRDVTWAIIRDVRKPNFGSVSVYKNPNRTEPKPKGQIRNFGFRGFSQNRICFIHIVNS